MRPAQPRRPAAAFAVRLLGAAIGLMALFCTLQARAAFIPPALDGHVVDTAGKLTPEDVDAQNRKLEWVRARGGADIAAFVVGSLEGEDIEDVAYTAFNAWELGQKGADNGVLLVIAPAERRVRIETGKGVGGALTDLQSNDIIRNTIAPLLQKGEVREAIDQGTTAIALAVGKGPPEEGTPPEAHDEPSLVRIGIGIGFAVLLIIFAIISPAFRSVLFFFLLFGRGGGGSGFGGGGSGGGRGGRSGGGGSSDSY